MGVHVRGGAVADMRWNSGKIVTLELHAKADGAIRLIPPVGQSVAAIRTSEGLSLTPEQSGIMHLKSGASYLLSFR